MKKGFLQILGAAAIMMMSVSSFAQMVPNGDFEQPISGGQLPNWQIINAGQSASTVNTANVTLNGVPTTIPCYGGQYFLVMQTSSTQQFVIRTNKFAFSNRPTSVRFQYIYFGSGTSTINMLFTRYNADSARIDTILNAFGNSGAVSNWTARTLNIPDNLYKSAENPDTAQVLITSGSGSGAVLMIDDIKFSEFAAGVSNSFRAFGSDVVIYPNPATGFASVSYELTAESDVQIGLYDIHGRLVQSVANATQTAGTYEAPVDLSNVAPGVYFVKVQAGEQVITKKLTVE